MTDPYRVLGVAPTAEISEVRRAYRRLAKRHHPDVGGDPATFERLKLAHDVLTDPERRRRFDETGGYCPT